MGLTGATALTGASYHTCAVKGDGTVWCWGNNGNGQLGDGSTTDSLTPVQVSGLSGATSIYAGGEHTCAMKDDGTLMVLGRERRWPTG